MLEVSQASAPHDHFLNPQPPSEQILTRTYKSLRSIQDGSCVAVSRLAELLAAPDEAENAAKRGSQTRRDRTLSLNSASRGDAVRLGDRAGRQRLRGAPRQCSTIGAAMDASQQSPCRGSYLLAGDPVALAIGDGPE